MRQWRKDMRVGESTFGLSVTVAKLIREVAKLRRRIIGGGTSSPPVAPSGGTYVGNYNPGASYQPGQIIRNLASIITIGTSSYNVQPGVYGCVVKPLPALAAGWNINMLPQYPEPTPSQGNGIVYWQLISLAPIMVNTCANGQRTIYINGSGSF